MWNWELYTGRGPQSEVGLTKRVVLSLCEPIYDRGHHVYMDNYFSSPELYSVLLENQTGACGTLRTNHTGVPPLIKQAKLKKGSETICERDGDLLYIAWFDKRQVTVLTSVHNSATFTKSVRSKGFPDNHRQIVKPKAIELYSRYMQGVDRADRLLWYQLHIHKTLKWWKKVFFYMMEVSVKNAGIIFRRLHPDHCFDPNKFRLSVVKGLIGNYVRPEIRPHRRPSNPPTRLVQHHSLAWNSQKTPSGKPAKPDCEVCSQRGVKRHQVETMCEQCHVPLCAIPCFHRYHTVVDYKVVCTTVYHRHN